MVDVRFSLPDDMVKRLRRAPPTLRELAAELKRLDPDPREVTIESPAPLPPLARTGLRGQSG